ncbi:MAG TPA: hypothetical protein VD993_19520 [Chitinophagaceae bacterium]|nr:hypothetical protein [Chitinophagaceae bacterium]
MRKLVTILVAVQLIALSGLKAQTVDDVINKYMEALGGKEKVQGIKSIYQEGVTVMQNGNELTIKTWKVQDKLFRREVQFGMGSQTTIITDKEGWRTDPRNGGAFVTIPEDRVKLQQSELDCVSPLVDYAAKGHTAELLGKEAVDGKECYKIKLTLKSGQPVTYFIDPTTWYVVRESRTGGGMGPGGGGQRPGGTAGDATFNINYSNYQKTEDGYIFPFTVSMGQGGLTFEKIEVNKPVDGKLYKPE